MPNSRSVNWILSNCFDRQRSTREPPFFFREVRIGMLVVSMLFNLGRLIYEATVKDVSVVLVAARLCLTIVQLVDHWWFCKNWESFFIEKKMRAYIWFRLFFTAFLIAMLYCVQKTFPPYTNYSRLMIVAFQWTTGVQVMIWYLWGRRWNFKWGDMSDERRIPAIVGAMFTTSLLYFIDCIYLKFTSTPSPQTAMTTSITATISYFLLGLALRYLNIVTNRSSQACRKILDESMVASATDGHSHGFFPFAEKQNSAGVQQPSVLTSFPSTRRNSNLMMNLRQSLDSRIQSVVSQMEPSSRRESSITADVADRIFGNNVDMIAEENRIENDVGDEEKGNIDRQPIREYVHPTCSVDGTLSHIISDNNSIALNRLNDRDGDNMGSASISSNMEEKGNDINRVRFKPVVSPSISRNNSSSHIDGSNNSITLNRPQVNGCDNIGSVSASSNVGGGGVDSDRVRVKPNSPHANSKSNSIVIESSGPPLCDITDHLMIDHVNIPLPLTRQNSLETNLATYETAHLLSDKIVVVFVQVKLP